MLTKETIEGVLAEIITDPTWYVVDIKMSLSKIRNKITILLDTDQGISIDQCGEVSRKIDKRLDELIEDAYVLEVSSPGIETPLTQPRQYLKNIGKAIKIIDLEGNELKGTINESSDKAVIILPEKKKKDKTIPEPISISFDKIKAANIQVSFK